MTLIDDAWMVVDAPPRLNHQDGLTTRMRQLRDAGPDIGPSEHTSTRRQARISDLQHEHGRTLAILVELDKYRVHAEQADCAPEVKRAMDDVIAERVHRLNARVARIQRDLHDLRRGAG